MDNANAFTYLARIVNCALAFLTNVTSDGNPFCGTTMWRDYVAPEYELRQ